MKIVIIRHGEVNMNWEKSYDTVTFDEACKNYDISSIKLIDKKIEMGTKHKIYISKLSRTRETALQLFGDKVFFESELFNEVPLKSFINTKKKLPLTVWNVMGRIQWMIGNKRQAEIKKQTVKRAKQAVLMLEQDNMDCYIVTHGFFVRTLLHELVERGFKINKNKIRFNNLEEITAYK